MREQPRERLVQHASRRSTATGIELVVAQADAKIDQSPVDVAPRHRERGAGVERSSGSK